MELSTMLMADQQLTFIDCIMIVAACVGVIRLLRSRHPKNEQERKARRYAVIGLVCVLVYALGRIALILLNR
jgi:hypothetical protein